MLRLFRLVLVMAICFSPCILFAGTIGNSIEPIGAAGFAIAAGSSYITDREIEPGGVSTSGATFTNFDIEKLYETELKFIFGVADNFNIYGKGGVAKLEELQLALSTGQNVEIESEPDMLYGGGFNAVCRFGYEEEYFVGIGGDYSRFKIDAEELQIAGVKATNVSGEIKKTEYQGNLYLGAKLEVSDWFSLTPYIAGFWNKFNIESSRIEYTSGGTFSLSFDNDADDEIGPAAGLSLNFSDRFSFNLEGRYIAGTAVSAGGTFKF